MKAYYNEHEPFAAEWLRNLIKAGLIADGDVDERDIQDVKGSDLDGYTQVHLFAGIGGWSYALRLAGWPDSRPVWTGSCPCQPWSVANVAHGGGAGADDHRHLWPEMFRLIRERKPCTLFGEQVPKSIRMGWLDQVFADLESIDYACGSLVLRADSFGADHQRRRLYWVAHAGGEGWTGHQPVERFSFAEKATLAVDGDSLFRARKVLAGDCVGLLPCDGLSVVMERRAVGCYGNAIVPACAARFIEASVHAIEQCGSQCVSRAMEREAPP